MKVATEWEKRVRDPALDMGQQFAYGRWFAVSERERLGHVPRCAVTGDCICVLCGGRRQVQIC
jgi:hypothetical protein